METILIAKKQSKWHGLGKRIKQARFLLLMILPAVAFYFIFSYIPMYGILMAFTKYYPRLGILGSLQQHWVGLDNFSIIFNNDPEFLNVLRNTILIGLGKIIIASVSAIIVALLINELRMRRFKKTAQIIVTFPHFLSWVVLAGFINVLFSSTGIVDDIIVALGGTRINFLADKSFFLTMIFASDVWKEAGWSSIIYLATMAGISPELYEAADIDGATGWHKIWHITLPFISPVIYFNLVMGIIGSLQVFAVPYAMFNGAGPSRSALFYATYIYMNAFRYNQMGYACAMSWVLFIIILFLTWFATTVSRKHIYYHGE